MSQFCSEFLSWTTAAVAGGAALLGSIDLPPAGSRPPDPPPAAVPVATADPAPMPEPREGPANPKVNTLPQIRAAELQDVDFTTSGRATDPRPAIGRVTGSTVNIRDGPGTNFAVVGQASLGDELVVTGERSGIWIEILTPYEEAKAWIHGRYFDPPDPAAMSRN